MDGHVYKKERSSRHHLRIDMENSLSQEEGGGLLLSNPVACGSISPGGPMSVSSTASHHHPSHPHNHHHHHHPHHPPSRISPPSSSSAGFTQSLNYSHSSSSTPVSGITRGGAGERSSFGKGSKNRSKSPALLRFFVRGSGSSRKTSEVEEEDYASSGSDHEDPFSPRSLTGVEISQNGRHTSESQKSRSVEHYATLPRQFRRNHSSTGSTSTTVTQRDSGFSSERESVSHMKDDLNTTLIAEDLRGSPTEKDYHPAGMEALEVLHNQLHILVKQECDSEETDAVNIYEQVIASLSRQIEKLSNSVDCLRQSDENLRLSLRLAEQRAMEAETKLSHAVDRISRSEQKYLKLAIRYQALAKKYRDNEQKSNVRRSMRGSRDWVANRSPLQRVQSQTQYDRENLPSVDSKRPSTAQGFHSDSDSTTQPAKSNVVSHSHTQTSV